MLFVKNILFKNSNKNCISSFLYPQLFLQISCIIFNVILSLKNESTDGIFNYLVARLKKCLKKGKEIKLRMFHLVGRKNAPLSIMLR